MSLGQKISSGVTITKGLYHMDGNSNDSSGNGLNGTDTDMAYSLDPIGQKELASFNGTSSRVAIGATTDFVFGGLTPFTIRCLLKGDHSEGILVSHHRNGLGVGLGSWSFTKHDAAGAPYYPANCVTLQRSDIGPPWPGYNSAYQTYDPTSDKRIHVVGVFNPAGLTAGSVQVFIDGNGGTELDSSSQDTNNYQTYIGCQGNSISPNPFNFFDGIIDEVIIEQATWSKRYIDRDYAQTLGRLAPCVI